MRDGSLHAVEKGNVAAIDASVSPDFIDHSLRMGLSSDRNRFKRTWATFRAAFPNFHVTVDDAIADGDKIVVRITNRGTHQGEFFGISPTGREVTFTSIVVFRIADRTIAERWGVLDMFGLLQQLGATPAR
jgi:predicted ester cyclase